MLKSNRSTVLSALLVSAFALLAIPAARAQLTFTVGEFTTDKLVLTLNSGTLLTTNGAPAGSSTALFLVDGVGTNTGWITSNVFTGGTGGNFGTATQDASQARNDAQGDYVVLNWNINLSTAGNLITDITYTFEGTGMFVPANVGTWALYWGDPIITPATLQSTGSATTGSSSIAAIPEPSAFAALAGLAGLGLAATRRRQRA